MTELNLESKKIIIDPVTRVEGHGKVTLLLDNNHQVEQARLHIVEFRGFEKFVQGRPYWEVPVLVQRLCGICPVSHHLCAAKAVDQLVGVEANDLTPVGEKMRRLMHYGQVMQSHALHFFYLAAPDLLFGMDADVEKYSIAGVATENRELALKGIQIRKFGQEIIKATAGKKIHGISAVPGGIHKNLSLFEKDYFLNGKDVPSIGEIISWSEEIIEFMKDYHLKNSDFIDNFAETESGHLSLVGKDGEMDLYHGVLRAIDSKGKRTLNDVDYREYLDYFSEAVEDWTYLKFPYLKKYGRDYGFNRVGPLARLNVCDSIPTPKAAREFEFFKSLTNGKTNNKTMHTHLARLIELLHCAEMCEKLLNDPDLQSDDLIVKGEKRLEGIGVIEAPRGTLLHHYRINDQDIVEMCNLIVSTTHNNEPMNQAVKWVAEKRINTHPKITEALLREVEASIRAYDPCLSCATHALGKMPLKLRLEGPGGELIDEYVRN